MINKNEIQIITLIINIQIINKEKDGKKMRGKKTVTLKC